MAKRYPGARWRPCPDGGAMERLDGCTWHEAVTRAESLFGWVQTARACHLYNGKHGDAEQYIDVGRVAWGVANGNSRMLTVESYDGLKIEENPYREIGIGGIYGSSANTGKWDAGQCERAADIMAWLHVEYGIPLRMMASSALSEKGHAPHRWGIDPWRKPNGQVWTAHAGKPCPGDLRVQQLPHIVSRAAAIAEAVRDGRCGWLPEGPVDVAAALDRTEARHVGGGGGKSAPKPATYTVQDGDTLSAIGRRFHVDPDDIARWSGIKNPDVITAGQVVRLVGPPPSKPKPKPKRKPKPGVHVKGVTVVMAQEALNAHGADPELIPDGDFGPKTEDATNAAKRRLGLPQDGVFGSRLWRALKPRVKTYTPPPGRWPLASGNYFGLVSGPAESHGGYYQSERKYIRWIKVRLRELGYKVPAGGIFRGGMKRAVAAWQHDRHASTTSRPGEVWADDWQHLINDR